MNSTPRHSSPKQHGSALLLTLLMLICGLMAVFSAALPSTDRNTRDAAFNAQVLSQAKAALIAFALTAGTSSDCAGNAPDCERPGDLPCPDNTADAAPLKNGKAASSCGNAQGTTGQSARLGRLPWKTLSIPDLRDASGQRLWYAVSNNFKKNTRIPVLNSDTAFGTISVRDTSGKLSFNGQNPGGIPSGVIAVIIAPGTPIKRQDGRQQNRSINAPQEYLDVVTINGIQEDNADFIDGSASNGFIQGPIKDAVGNVISNDQFVLITYDEIMKGIEQRVAGEAMRELASYDFPRPAAFADTTCLITGSDNAILSNTACQSSSAGETCGRIPVNSSAASPIWGVNSSLRGGTGNLNSWFQANLWREFVFYALPGNCNGVANSTLDIAGVRYTKAVIVVAGRLLPTSQKRQNINTEKINRANYFEASNGNSLSFASKPRSNLFNDTVVGQ